MRQAGRAVAVGVWRQDPSTYVGRLAETPRHPVREIERASLIDEIVVSAGVGGRRLDGDQMRRTHLRRLQCRRRQIAHAVHADLAIRIGQLRGPLDRVESVLGLIVRPGHAVRRVASARVLDDDDVPLRDEPALALAFSASGVLGVRGALQEHGELAGRVGAVHIGAEDDAVAHARFDVLVHDHLGVARRLARARPL